MPQDRDPGAAILRFRTVLGEFRFLCPAELQGVYAHSNEYNMPQFAQVNNLLKDSTPKAWWHGGKDSEVSLELKLVVGASIDIETPEQLMDTMRKLAAICQSKSKATAGQDDPGIVALQIGTWFYRQALVLSGSFGFGRPWDPDTGLPYVGFVNYSLQYVSNQLNTARTFRFDRA